MEDEDEGNNEEALNFRVTLKYKGRDRSFSNEDGKNEVIFSKPDSSSVGSVVPVNNGSVGTVAINTVGAVVTIGSRGEVGGVTAEDPTGPSIVD